MNKLKNERGFVLVVTLMIVTLILLFILTQFYQITNTTKQVDTVEHSIEARLMAEMGIDYYRSQIDQFKNEKTIYDFTNSLSKSVQVDQKGEFNFSISLKEITKENDVLTLEIVSTGKAFGIEEKVEDTLKIKNYHKSVR